MMPALPALLLLSLGTLGAGGLVLRALGLSLPEYRDRLAHAMALGFGLVGWLMFFIGIAGQARPVMILALCLVLAPGVALLGRPRFGTNERLGWGGRLALAALFAAVAMTLIAGMAPPTDADSLAYHFDLPRRFAETGRVVFIPRAVDGAIPLLPQMTYLAAYSLGGEGAMTAWTALTTLAAAFVFFAAGRSLLPLHWSLGLAVAFLSLPAVVYGGTSGQVEVRAVLFAVTGALAAARAARERDWRWAVVAGLSAGFYGATKYYGLLFMAAAGVAVLMQPRWLRAGLIYSAAAVLAAFQWYWWNWLHTGDPIFPMLYPILGAPAEYWNDVIHASFRVLFFEAERAVPANLAWFLAYPFVATLGGPGIFESSRTGLGPLILLILPLAVAGLWRFRARLAGSQAILVVLILAIQYSLWFFFTGSQRVRHLLPLYPLLLLLVQVAAERAGRAWGLTRPLAVALAATIALQLGGQALFTRNFAAVAVGRESRAAFVARTIFAWPAVEWANHNLGPGDRLMVFQRHMVYYLRPEVFQAHHSDQAQIDARREADDEGQMLRQMRHLGITHVMSLGPGSIDTGPEIMLARLHGQGCLERIDSFEVVLGTSRTVSLDGYKLPFNLFRLNAPGCRPEDLR